MTPRPERCNAPDCGEPATILAIGRDWDGSPFQERVCDSCAVYLLETGAALELLTNAKRKLKGPP